jgi:hypothetical protein
MNVKTCSTCTAWPENQCPPYVHRNQTSRKKNSVPVKKGKSWDKDKEFEKIVLTIQPE